MSLLTISFLCFFFPCEIHSNAYGVEDYSKNHLTLRTIEDIDSLDRVIFDLDQSWSDGEYVEIPVFIESDDIINTLDFSMGINIQNLEFHSVVDHTGELQYASFFNPNDLKLRFTSNSFSPYPLLPLRVVSIRFRVLSGMIAKSDLQSIIAYLNGDPCSVECKGEKFVLSSGDVVIHENFISPNPAADFISIHSEEGGWLNVFDLQGKLWISSLPLNPNELNRIDVQALPRGSYTVSLVSKDHKVRMQKIVLQ